MFKLIKNLFCNNSKIEEQESKVRLPKIGDVYILNDHYSPWAYEEKVYIATIVDIKDGWVRYYLGRSNPGKDYDAKKIPDFLKIYTLISPPQTAWEAEKANDG